MAIYYIPESELKNTNLRVGDYLKLDSMTIKQSVKSIIVASVLFGMMLATLLHKYMFHPLGF